MGWRVSELFSVFIFKPLSIVRASAAGEARFAAVHVGIVFADFGNSYVEPFKFGAGERG